MNQESRPDWLERRLDDLPREIAPENDLWPAIAARIAGRPRWRLPSLALAATVVLSAGFALLGWQAYRAAEAERAATAAMIAELLAPYAQLRTERAARWAAFEEGLDPALRAALDGDRDTLDHAQAALIRALEEDPADPALHLLLRQVIDRESELLETGTRATRYRL